MARSVVVTVPCMPPRECGPNYRGHWTKRAAAAAFYRACAYHAAREALLFAPNRPPIADGAVMDIEVAWCCGRKAMDDDNLIAAVKPCRDGVADVLGGGDAWLRTGAVTQTRGNGETIITLRGA